MSEILENDNFDLPFDLVSGTNKQSSKPTESWMNFPYLNKKISKLQQLENGCKNLKQIKRDSSTKLLHNFL